MQLDASCGIWIFGSLLARLDMYLIHKRKKILPVLNQNTYMLREVVHDRPQSP